MRISSIILVQLYFRRQGDELPQTTDLNTRWK